MAQRYVQVNIGRDAHGHPLSGERWNDFISAVRTTLAGWANMLPHLVYEAYGYDENSEEQFACLFVWGAAQNKNSDSLIRSLSHIAATYQQEQIALIDGTTILIEARDISEEASYPRRGGRHAMA